MNCAVIGRIRVVESVKRGHGHGVLVENRNGCWRGKGIMCRGSSVRIRRSQDERQQGCCEYTKGGNVGGALQEVGHGSPALALPVLFNVEKGMQANEQPQKLDHGGEPSETQIELDI